MRRSVIAVGVLLVFCLSCAVSLADAATLRVEKDGSGDYTVIQDAVDAAAVGDTILIGPGRYEEHKPFTTSTWTEETYVAVTVDSLTIRGTDRDNVIIGPPAANFVGNGPKGIALSLEMTTALRVEHLSIENVHDGLHLFHTFELDSLSVAGCSNGAFIVASDGSQIRRSLFHDCSFDGIFTGTSTSNITIEDCEFVDNFQFGVGINRTTNAIIRRCSAVNGGILLSDGSTGLVEDCTIDGSSGLLQVSYSTIAEVNNCAIATANINISVKTYSHLSGSGNVLPGGAYRTMRFAGNSTADFHGNHILHGTGHTVDTDAYLTTPIQIDLTGNYWGTADRDSIEAWIVDGNDPPDPPYEAPYADVLFEPFETKPVPLRKSSVGSFKALFRDPR